MSDIVSNIFDSTPWGAHTKLLGKYLDLLFEYNEKYNIFSRKQTREDILRNHIYDSLLGEKFVPCRVAVIDVGTGAGFPGLCWAIVRDDLKIVLAEKSYRKVQFLEKAIVSLGLSERVTVCHDNIQNISLEKIDVVVSRAMCSAQKLTDLIGFSSLKGKKIILYKALESNIELELSQLSRSCDYEIHRVLPLSDKTRNIVLMRF